MGHLVFLAMHLLAFVFGFVFLFVTVPMHLVYCAIKSNS